MKRSRQQAKEAQADAECQAAAETMKKMDDEYRDRRCKMKIAKILVAVVKKEVGYAEWQAATERAEASRKAAAERVDKSRAAEAEARKAAAWQLKQDRKQGRIYTGRGGWKAKIAAEGLKID